MRGYYIFVIAMVVVAVGMLLYPTIKDMYGYVDTTGWLPLVTAGFTLIPYAFIGFIIYAIIQRSRR